MRGWQLSVDYLLVLCAGGSIGAFRRGGGSAGGNAHNTLLRLAGDPPCCAEGVAIALGCHSSVG